MQRIPVSGEELEQCMFEWQMLRGEGLWEGLCARFVLDNVNEVKVLQCVYCATILSGVCVRACVCACMRACVRACDRHTSVYQSCCALCSGCSKDY